ncbi:hypothetical protein N7468_005382 [Penicillium chermesinum]|uniref:HAUS augmin-like complex subunit 6 N-terminal domain-containing protein n=1 Tax=Penicillium chermesinum TaxID=63820 RepID=A0A9W9NZ36_9EURO|nr:uncharacterized protein N7468_005382 [Penicillium chermesinum]KAJ5232426.1 hypothetical protein N7468_005382 [Penicillium chermesinum]KAJ6172085.1 hypothetical protein N7470_001152 [Penicillium chermesinum]
MAAPRPARPKPLEWLGPSNLTVFIRNLKLLHLDHREDWPDITLRSLSPSSQNQRQRIRLVEWALYYLFTIWDPEGAQNKLRPFFPPLEPLQSVNLRAALFRALSDLKKNGDLGRETILRKTMLDDCKGEKFDELLATFSTAVLRKLVTVSTGDMLWNPAMRIASASSISPVDYQNMVPLIIAHQNSLSTSGARRARAHQAYNQFSRLLDEKKAELTERAKRETNGEHDELSADAETLTREIRANWLGSEEWATAILDGGAQSSTDAFLELPFSQAWAQVAEHNVDSLANGSKQDLVVDLEARILHLRGRLRRWNEFNDLLAKDKADGKNSPGETHDTRLVFRDHQALNVASISKAVRQSSENGRALSDSDESFMSTVAEAISLINGNPRETNPQSRSGSPQRKTPAMAMNIPSQPSPSNYQTISPPFDNEHSGILTDTSHSSEPASRQSSPPTVRLTPDPEPVKTTTSNTNYTLAERTRKSMSLIPPLPREPAPRPRRGPRPSFPTNQFETPRKSSAPIRSTTPQDKLFEEDAEYSSVFKSRPRIALSPVASPAVHIPGFDELDEFGLGYDDEDVGDVDSPLAAPRYR